MDSHRGRFGDKTALALKNRKDRMGLKLKWVEQMKTRGLEAKALKKATRMTLLSRPMVAHL